MPNLEASVRLTPRVEVEQLDAVSVAEAVGDMEPADA